MFDTDDGCPDVSIFFHFRTKVWGSRRYWENWSPSVWARFQPCWMGRYRDRTSGSCFSIVWMQKLNSTSEEVRRFPGFLVHSLELLWFLTTLSCIATDCNSNIYCLCYSAPRWTNLHFPSRRSWRKLFLTCNLRSSSTHSYRVIIAH